MKITTFNPQVITKDPQSAIALFEALGFERTHNKTGSGELEFSSVRMKRRKDGSDTDSFHIDVVEAKGAPIQSDLMAIRINVDDFDGAYETLKSRGFQEAEGFGVTRIVSSKFAFLISPSGFLIDLCQHIKE